MTANFVENKDFHFDVSEEERVKMVDEWKKNREHCDTVFIALAAHVFNLRWKLFTLKFFL